MKTDAIKSVLGSYGFTHDVSEAVSELFALEESHADMARALMAFYRSGHACHEDETQCLHCTAAAALRKAGVL